MLKATMIASGILAGTAATALWTTADDAANDGAVIGSASAATISDFAVCHTPATGHGLMRLAASRTEVPQAEMKAATSSAAS